MKKRITFALLMGVITTGVISLALIYLNLGFGGLFLKVWIRSWGLAYLIVIPVILVIAPKLQGLIAKLFTGCQRRLKSDPLWSDPLGVDSAVINN